MEHRWVVARWTLPVPRACCPTSQACQRWAQVSIVGCTCSRVPVVDPEGDVHFTTIGEMVSIETKVIQKAGATELHASEEYSARWPGEVSGRVGDLAALRIWQHVDVPVATQRNSQELAATAIMQQMAEKVEKGKMRKNKRGEEHGQLQARSKW